MKTNQNYFEIAIIDSNPSLDFELDQNRCPNLESEFESTTTNQFGDPNCLSFVVARPLGNLILRLLRDHNKFVAHF